MSEDAKKVEETKTETVETTPAAATGKSKNVVLGLKRMRKAGSKRNGDWGNPNRKAKARLDARIKEFEKHGDKGGAFHRPGSMKVK